MYLVVTTVDRRLTYSDSIQRLIIFVPRAPPRTHRVNFIPCSRGERDWPLVYARDSFYGRVECELVTRRARPRVYSLSARRKIRLIKLVERIAAERGGS